MIEKSHSKWVSLATVSILGQPPRYLARMQQISLLLLGLILTNGIAAKELGRTGELLSLNIQQTDIAEVYEMLSRQQAVNVILGKGVGGEISVNLYDVTLEKAINLIALSAGFAVEKTRDAFFISTRDSIGKDIPNGLTEVRTLKVQYSDALKITEILTNHLSRFGKITPLAERQLLVIEDMPEFLDRIEKLLTTIDRRPSQILIEAKILEIKLDDNENYGIDWKKLFEGQSGKGAFGIKGLAAPGTPGFFFNLANSDIDVTLTILADKGRVRTLSTPKLLALEHQESIVIVGDRKGYRETTTINQVTTESIKFLESGVILRVTSYVDESGKIMMDVHPEVSTGTVSDGIPSQTTTEVSTQLLAADGETIFIGGLIKRSTGKRHTGVPILGDVPFLGYLFSSNETVVFDTETVVLLTPRIMHDGESVIHREQGEYIDEVDKSLKRRSKKIDKLFDSGHW